MLLKLQLKFFYRFCKRDHYNKILLLEGFKVGTGTIFYDPNSMTIDRERPWMLEIGEYCKITRGSIILTHDYSRSVLRRAYGEIIGEASKTIIGNNVFIGMNSIILMGCKIGNNVIVGAGSVVSGIIPDNVVVAGNPAKIIRSLDDHYHRRKSKLIIEAKLYATTFFDRYNRLPTINEMNAFFPLYLERTLDAIQQNKINLYLNGDNFQEILHDFLKTKPVYNSFEEFINETFPDREKIANNS